MKRLFAIGLVLILLFIPLAEAKSIIKTETVISDGIGDFGLGDRIDKIYYSDGTNQTKIIRSIFSLTYLMSLASYPTDPIQLEYGVPKDITLPITMNGYKCVSIYDNVVLADVHIDSNSGVVIASTGAQFVGCGGQLSTTISIPSSTISSWFTQPGGHILVIDNKVRLSMKWYNDGYYTVNVVTPLAPTPAQTTPSPTITTPIPTPTSCITNCSPIDINIPFIISILIVISMIAYIVYISIIKRK